MSGDNIFQEAFKKAIDWKHKFENEQISGAIIGQTGNGKSSLINAFAGEEIAEVVHHVQGGRSMEKAATYQVMEGCSLTDCPGVGTELFPAESYVKKLKLDSFDFYIWVINRSITGDELKVYRELKNAKKDIFFVRNKIDEALKGTSSKEEVNERMSEVKKQCFEETKTNAKLYMVSAEQPHKWDFGILQEDIANSLDDTKKMKFIQSFASYSEEFLELKKKNAIKIANNYSIAAAAAAAGAALVPIPGAGVSADIAVLISMSKHIKSNFGLNDKTLDFLEGRLGKEKVALLKLQVAKSLLSYATKEGVIILLKKYASREFTKEVLKFIPFIGPIVSAGLSYQITASLGDDLIKDCYKCASDILTEIQRQNES